MVMSPEQKQAASERMKAMHAAKKATKTEPKTEPMLPPIEANPVPEIAGEQSISDLKRQIQEMKQMQDVMMVALRNNSNANLSAEGKVLGVIEKYALDPDNYPDPTPRLAQEPRLQPMAFNLNYELAYQVATSSYETKSGVNMKEPKFLITLARVVLDDNGLPTNKRYVVKRMVFHEDPQAAIVIARENGIDLDDYKDMENTTENQRKFLNEMRYIRVRDWLFGIFWRQPVQPASQLREEVIGNQIVQVFTKNSENSSEIDFSKIGDSKLRS